MAEAVNRSLQRGLQLLELLSEHPEGMELHAICFSSWYKAATSGFPPMENTA